MKKSKMILDMDEEVKNNFTSAPIFHFVVLGNLVVTL